VDPADVAEEVAAVTRHWAYEPLFEAWCAAHDRAAIDRLLSALREPGPIALRCRFRHLLDPGRPDLAAGTLVLNWDQWEELLTRETRADVLLRMGPQEQQQARSAFEALAGLEYQPAHRVVTVNALHGLADVARHVDDRDAALRLLQEAAAISAQDGYRFGRARALVSLGYLISTVSVTAAAEHFTEAAALARDVGDRLYQANAELGLAETNQRLRRCLRG
jgi:tetratricopeptide (TPR) repeat protein